MQTPHHSTPTLSERLLKMATLYMIFGLLLGLFMAITGEFQWRAVHTHVNLLGWVTLAIVGLVYRLYPQLEDNRLASSHYWLHNLGLPVMMTALAIYHNGHREIEPLLGLGSVLTLLGLLLFAANLWLNIGVPSRDTSSLIGQTRFEEQ